MPRTGWHRTLRGLHLYLGLFLSPFLLIFASSAVFLVHAWVPTLGTGGGNERVVSGLPLPPDIENLSGRERIAALRPALQKAGVHGEVGWIQHVVKEGRLIFPVSVPGRETIVTVHVPSRVASMRERTTGLADALAMLHKSPGPHLTVIRMNWFPMRIWGWLADATVYLICFVTLSGVYLWLGLQAERKIGVGLLVTGAVTFLILAYALAQ